MHIERHEIEKLATLARIAIDEDTISDVTARLSSVLDLVDQLQAIDTDGVAPKPGRVDERRLAGQLLKPQVDHR